MDISFPSMHHKHADWSGKLRLRVSVVDDVASRAF